MNPHEKRKMLQVQSKLEQALSELQLRADPIYIPEILEPLKEALVLVNSLLLPD